MLLWVGAAGTASIAAPLPAVTVGVSPSTDMSLLIIAVKKEFLKKEGLNARLQFFDASPAALRGVVAGQADITENTEPPQLAARARGGKIVQIMTGYLSGKQNGVVVNGNAIKKPEDFIGKTIGVQRGSGADYHLVWFLERHKIPKNKVTVEYMAAPDQIAALAHGDIQAFFSWQPYLAKAADSIPNAKIYSRSVDDGLLFSGNVVIREDLAKNHKDIAVKIVKGLIATAEWMTANPREAAQVANEVLRAPSVDLVYHEMQNLSWPGNFKKSVAAQELRIAEWGTSIGLFPTKNPKKLVDDLVYPAIIKEAAPSRTDF
jgi:NitT/TauT family transport system substrate-binding protein